MPADRRRPPGADLGTITRLLYEGRSCLVEVVNLTSETLTLTDATAVHGAFVTQPARRIARNGRDAFGCQNLPKGLGVGCEGIVTYFVAEDATVTLHFDNPFAGRNFAGAQFAGIAASMYTCEASAEAGDQHVRIRFTIRGNPSARHAT